jgi:hypothetical protein
MPGSLTHEETDALNQYRVQLQGERRQRLQDEAIRLVGESWVGRYGRKHLIRRVMALHLTATEAEVQSAVDRLERDGRLVVVPRPAHLAQRGARARYRLAVEGHHAQQAPGMAAPTKGLTRARIAPCGERERAPFQGRVTAL